jgi:predicted alpha/beta superfamily hydrolase
MKKVVFLLIVLLCFKAVNAQYTLRLIVSTVATKKLDDIYVAGSFNNWNPGDAKYKLKPYGTSRRAIVLKDLPAGKYQFKFTRGTWEKGEVTAKGADIENREADLSADVSQDITVAGWKDDYPDKPKPNTATAQVKIIDTAFAIPQLNRTRRIWLYLPKSYAASHKNYPVLYMQDGQNLFNEQTAPFGEWGVDEALDSLQAKTGKECIVVGIDNGDDKRMTEYNPYDQAKFGKGEGNQYVQFIAETLKPFIDKQYRTIKDPAHTFIAGSSMGGLISIYAVIKYPNVFGGAGVFSPAFWTAPSIYDDAVKATLPGRAYQFYFYAGGQEGGLMVPDMDKMVSIIESKGSYHTRRVMAPLGKHNEPTWRKEFPDFYKFIMQ